MSCTLRREQSTLLYMQDIPAQDLPEASRRSKEEQIIHQAVRCYQLTSRSRKLWRLQPKYEAKIAQGINRKNQHAELAALAQKQRYYTDKLNELLNRAAEEKNPRSIDDKDEAAWYIRRYVAQSPEKMKKVEFQVWRQAQFQREFRREADSANVLKIGLAKLQSVNAESEKRREREMQQMHAKYAEKQVLLAKECEEELRDLEVPFFVSAGLQENRAFVLDLLYRCVQEGVKD